MGGVSPPSQPSPIGGSRRGTRTSQAGGSPALCQGDSNLKAKQFCRFSVLTSPWRLLPCPGQCSPRTGKGGARAPAAALPPRRQNTAVPTLPWHEDAAAGEGRTKPPLLGNSCLLGVPIAQFQGSWLSWDGQGQPGSQVGQEWAEGAVPGVSSHRPAGLALTEPSWRQLWASCAAEACAVPAGGLCRTRAGAG